MKTPGLAGRQSGNLCCRMRCMLLQDWQAAIQECNAHCCRGPPMQSGDCGDSQWQAAIQATCVAEGDTMKSQETSSTVRTLWRLLKDGRQPLRQLMLQKVTSHHHQRLPQQSMDCGDSQIDVTQEHNVAMSNRGRKGKISALAMHATRECPQVDGTQAVTSLGRSPSRGRSLEQQHTLSRQHNTMDTNLKGMNFKTTACAP